MITKTLAERLRMMYIEMRSKNPGGVEGFDTPLFFEAIAQAEREKAGERVVMDSEWATDGCREVWAAAGYNDKERAAERFRQGPYQAWACGWMESRLALVGSGIYAKPSQATGEPVAWTSKERLEELAYRGAAGGMFRGNMGEVANIPLYRSPISTEARDRAIEALEKVIDLWKDELINEGYDTSTNFDKATQALSALR